MRLPAAALAYAVVTALLFRGLLPDLTTHLYSDLGDPLLNTAILAWSASELPLTNDWWNFPSYAPLSGVTAFTEHLLLTYPVASPIIWLTDNPVLAYNVVFLLAMPLNGLAAYALARELTGSGAGAFIGGLAYAFAPYQSVHLSHLQHMTSFGMPFALLWLHRYLRTGRRSALIGFGIGWLMTGLANSALLIFFPMVALLWCIWFVRPPEWRRALALAVTAAVATLPLVPLLWGYYVRQGMYGFSRSYAEIQSFSADMVGWLGMYHRAAAWRGLLPHDFEEGALFPGFTTAALALLAVATAIKGGAGAWPRRLFVAFGVLTAIVLARIAMGPWGWHFGPLPLPPFRPFRLFTLAAVLLIAGAVLTHAFRRAWSDRNAVVGCAAALVVMWLLALGPQPEWSTPWRALASGPYHLLMSVPGVTAMRVPARAWFPGLLCLAMLAAYGASFLVRRYPQYAARIVVMVAALIVGEGWFVDGTWEAPRPMRAGAIPEGAVVLDLPMDEGFHSAVPQFRAVLGGYRTINGYSGYEPPHFLPFRRAIRDFLPDTFEPYRRVNDLYVVVRPELDLATARWIAAQEGAEHRFDLGDTKVYRLPRLP